MCVFCWNSDTTTDPPRAELLRKQNPNLNEMKKIGFRNDRHVIIGEGKLAIGVDGRDECSSGALPLPLGGHRDFFSIEVSGLENLGEVEERMKRESEARAWKSKKSRRREYKWGFWGRALFLKCQIITQKSKNIKHHSVVTSKTPAVSCIWTNYQACKQNKQQKTEITWSN
jgi:hypothetical protein